MEETTIYEVEIYWTIVLNIKAYFTSFQRKVQVEYRPTVEVCKGRQEEPWYD